MQIRSRFIVLFAIISLTLFASNAYASVKVPVTDTICCNPDSLKVVSVIYPTFCVSWRISLDSPCRVPYAFQVQWRRFPSSDPWTEAIKIYTGGTTISFCSTVNECRAYQWRVRVVCDSIDSTFSDWVYGPKFGMNCTGDKNLKTPGEIEKAGKRFSAEKKVTQVGKIKKPEE